jgi:hypothetical protein
LALPGRGGAERVSCTSLPVPNRWQFVGRWPGVLIIAPLPNGWPDFSYDRLKALIAGPKVVTSGADRITLVNGGVTLGDNSGTVSKRGVELRAQRVDIVVKYVADVCHDPRRVAEDKPSCC